MDTRDAHPLPSSMGGSDPLFRALVEHARDLILVLEAGGRVVYANPAASAVLGGARGGQRLFDFVHPDDKAALRQSLRLLFAPAPPSSPQPVSPSVPPTARVTVRLRDAEGAWRTVEALGRLHATDTPPPLALVHAHDITERLRAEAALRERAQRYRALVEQSADAIFVLQDDRYVLVNPAWEALFGYAQSEALSPRFDPMRLVAPESRAFIERRRGLWEARQPRSLTYAFQGLRRDGQVLDIEAQEAEILWEGRRALQGIFHDLTARKRDEAALRRYAERLEVLRAIDQALLSAESLTTIAEAAVEHIQQLIPCTGAYVFLVDPEHPEALRPVARVGVPLPRSAEATFPLSELVGPASFQSGRMELLPDLVAEARTSPLIARFYAAGLRAMMRVPLRMRDELIGLFILGADRPQVFTLTHLSIAREAAEQLSVAMRSVRLFDEVSAARTRLEILSRRLVEVQEQERRHLALELHDEIGQMLTGLNYTLDFTADDLAGPSRERLLRARALVDMLTTQVRNLSLELRPSMLDDLGLLPALTWYFSRYRTQTGLTVAFESDLHEGQRFPAEVETTAYRIIQEALTNVARHAGLDAGADAVRVRAWTEDLYLCLEVTDPGRGFDLRAAHDRPSAGLSGMQERAALVGGHLTVETAPGQGVNLSARLPR